MNLLRNISSGIVVSFIACWILTKIVGSELAGVIILCALPGIIVGAAITIMQYFEEMKGELKGEKKEEK